MKITNEMSKHPYQVSSQMLATEAYDLMKKAGFRHLPVLEDGKVVGIVSERDLHSLVKEKTTESTVESYMTKNPYIVNENEPLLDVIKDMRTQKYGCAIVIDDQQWVSGIFTTIDALKLLEKLLEKDEGDKNLRFSSIEKYLIRNDQRPAVDTMA